MNNLTTEEQTDRKYLTERNCNFTIIVEFSYPVADLCDGHDAVEATATWTWIDLTTGEVSRIAGVDTLIDAKRLDNDLVRYRATRLHHYGYFDIVDEVLNVPTEDR